MSPFNPRGGRRPLPPQSDPEMGPNSQTLDRALPSHPAPSSAGPSGVYNLTEPKTFLTRAGGIVQLLPAMQSWCRLTLTLETAGPVEISSSSSWAFGSGQGQTLITNVPLVYTIARGNNIYIQAGSSERVRVVSEPIPWLEAISNSIQIGFRVLAKAVAALAAGIRGE